jgi:hypothetical protein
VGQLEHATAAELATNHPAAQFVQTPAATAEYAPGEQLMHAADDFDPLVDTNNPAAHAVHAMAPPETWCCPAAHGAHAFAPDTDEKWPGAQSTQVEVPTLLSYRPAEQLEQPLALDDEYIPTPQVKQLDDADAPDVAT